jgi:hypothetical protein
MNELTRDCASKRRWGKNTLGKSWEDKKYISREERGKKILECKVGDRRGKKTRESILRKGEKVGVVGS